MAVFKSLPRTPENCRLIIEAKRLGAGVEGALWGLLMVLVVGSGISIYYYLRIVYRMLLQPEQGETYRVAGLASMGSYVVLAILLVAVLLLGVYPAFLMSLIQTVAVSI